MRFIVLGIVLLVTIGPSMAAHPCPKIPCAPCVPSSAPCSAHYPSCCSKPCPSWWARGWAITVYSGPLTSQTTSKIPFNPDFEGSAIIVAALAKEMARVWKNRLGIELETQYVQHFRGQTHIEINPIVLILRWRAFPWNKTLPTTLAIGDGLSIATRVPTLEYSRRGPDTARILNYLMAELTLSLPSLPQWALVGRYHHRSGAFGTFYGVHDASTAFCAGIKYWF